jgi:hypothetical protein
MSGRVPKSAPIVRRRGGSITVEGEVREAVDGYDPTKEFDELLKRTSATYAASQSDGGISEPSSENKAEVSTPAPPANSKLPTSAPAPPPAPPPEPAAEATGKTKPGRGTKSLFSGGKSKSKEARPLRKSLGEETAAKYNVPIVRRDERGSLTVEGGEDNSKKAGYDPTQVGGLMRCMH